MQINALLMDPKDNVVTTVADIAAGAAVVWQNGTGFCKLTALEAIPNCHKVALTDLNAGNEVIKYGESLGVMTQPVQKGGWVSHMNLVSVPRDYASEMIPE